MFPNIIVTLTLIPPPPFSNVVHDSTVLLMFACTFSLHVTHSTPFPYFVDARQIGLDGVWCSLEGSLSYICWCWLYVICAKSVTIILDHHGSDEDGCAVALSSCWEATVDRDFLHHNFLYETTLLPFRVPAFQLSWLSELE